MTNKGMSRNGMIVTFLLAIAGLILILLAMRPSDSGGRGKKR